MPTARLYFDDPLLVDFEAQVLEHKHHQGRPSVLLDRSAFYPEGGGQLPDTGVLGGVQVVDVQVDTAGNVHHLLVGELPDVGTQISGRVDRGRRRLHMAEHTAQHVLSRALVEVAGAETVSARLGESACTIDVDRADLSDGQLERVESLATGVVDDDVTIRAFFPSADELRALPLRRAPKVDESIRVVVIGDFDVTPCGGTHCTHASQIGLIRILAFERYKGGTRVTFSAGARARELLADESARLRALGRGFTCGPRDVTAAVERLRRELDDARGELGRARARLAELRATELVAGALGSGETHVVALLEDVGADLLRSVGARITDHAELVAIVAGTSADGLHLFVARGTSSSFDCGRFVKRLCERAGGRGGGRPERAEGRLPAGVDFVCEARALLVE